MQFLWWPSFKALYFRAVKPKRLLGEKVTLDDFSSAKMFFQSRCETSSKHPRRWFKVQRTRLNPFLISEAHLGRIKSRGRLCQKIVIFRRFFSSGCAYVCKYFLVGCAAQKGPEGSYLRGKSCPTSLRYLVVSESDFEWTKNRDSPTKTWTRSFKRISCQKSVYFENSTLLQCQKTCSRPFWMLKTLGTLNNRKIDTPLLDHIGPLTNNIDFEGVGSQYIILSFWLWGGRSLQTT